MYGKLNVLRLTGVVRLDDGVTEGAAARGVAARAAFAAWAEAEAASACDEGCEALNGEDEEGGF